MTAKDRPIQPDGRLHGVIVGCQREDGRWLLIRRSASVAAPLTVAFPGGAVECGEPRGAAAVRELREELGVAPELVQLAWRHDAVDRPLTLWGYLGRLDHHAVAPDAQEVAEVLYLTPAEIAAHPDTLPGCEAFAAALEAALEATSPGPA